MKWRLHWLELRLRELAYQRARHEAAYARLCGAATDAEATAEIGARRKAAATQDPAHDSTPAPQHAAGRSGVGDVLRAFKKTIGFCAAVDEQCVCKQVLLPMLC